MRGMKRTDLGRNLTTKRTRKRELLAQVNPIVPWSALEELVVAYARMQE